MQSEGYSTDFENVELRCKGKRGITRYLYLEEVWMQV